jgi:hypothetical protein
MVLHLRLCLFLFNIVLRRFIHLVSHSYSFFFVAKYYCIDVRKYHKLCTHSTVDGSMGCFLVFGELWWMALLKHLCIFLLVNLFFGGTRVWTLGFMFAKLALNHLRHIFSPFCCGYFGDGVLWTICLGWPGTMILLISACIWGLCQMYKCVCVCVCMCVCVCVCVRVCSGLSCSSLFKMTKNSSYYLYSLLALSSNI